MSSLSLALIGRVIRQEQTRILHSRPRRRRAGHEGLASGERVRLMGFLFRWIAEANSPISAACPRHLAAVAYRARTLFRGLFRSFFRQQCTARSPCNRERGSRSDNPACGDGHC